MSGATFPALITLLRMIQATFTDDKQLRAVQGKVPPQRQKKCDVNFSSGRIKTFLFFSASSSAVVILIRLIPNFFEVFYTKSFCCECRLSI